MEEQTITEPTTTQPSGGINGIAVDEAGRALPEPEQVVDTAGSQTEEPVQEAKVESAQPEAGEIDNTATKDDDLAKWAANKGIEVTTEAERKLAEMARNSEKAFHTKASEASQLQKSVTSTVDETDAFGDPLTTLQQEFQQLKLEQSVRNFYQDHPDAKEMDAQLSEIVQTRPHLANDLEALYAVAKLDNLNRDSDNLRKDGARQALESLAARQSATAPVAQATSQADTGGKITASNVDSLIARNGHSWYMENRDEINRVIEGR